MSTSDSCSVNDGPTTGVTTTATDAATTAAAAAVDAAACKAIELVRKYADQDPSDGAWKNPTDIYQQLDKAREDVLRAWEELHVLQQKTLESGSKGTAGNSADARNKADDVADDDLRAQFMDMVTDAFADVLNQMKEAEEDIDVDVLVDCLQSGIDLMSVEDRELLFQDNSENAVTTEEDGTDTDEKHAVDESGSTTSAMTPHEERRRKLGFDVETTAA